jgi:hypothetical protein
MGVTICVPVEVESIFTSLYPAMKYAIYSVKVLKTGYLGLRYCLR